jgi:hypothetical protein
MQKTSKIIFIGSFLLFCASIFNFAAAQMQSANTITVCVNKKTGAMVYRGNLPHTECNPKLADILTWNIRGEKGDIGERGPVGPAGTISTSTIIAVLSSLGYTSVPVVDFSFVAPTSTASSSSGSSSGGGQIVLPISTGAIGGGGSATGSTGIIFQTGTNSNNATPTTFIFPGI